MANSVDIKIDFGNVDAGLDAITTQASKSVRPAAQAGAQVFYDEVLLRVPVNTKVVRRKDGRLIQPGALKASIYQVFSKDKSPEGVATYDISWNARKAPHGHLVENGTSRAPAHSFLRPSFDAKESQAVVEAQKKLADEMALVLGNT